MKFFVIGGTIIFFGFAILFISVLRTAAVKYEKVSSPDSSKSISYSNLQIDYDLAYPGKVLPGSLFWILKAARDKFWLFVTTNDSRRAELLLLFADKRIGSSLLLMESSDVENSISTATKAEKYLEEALNQNQKNRARGIKTSEFDKRLAMAALKHYEILLELESSYPDQLRPVISNTKKYPMRVYEQSRNNLLEDGLTPPENPFNWQ
ncbi:MAG: DUF5667 domain-containing protein [Patescibacteria group bacterium]|nr:DUF5667 domain-containing protein [Patescibacteria group bacterium]